MAKENKKRMLKGRLESCCLFCVVIIRIFLAFFSVILFISGIFMDKSKKYREEKIIYEEFSYDSALGERVYFMAKKHFNLQISEKNANSVIMNNTDQVFYYFLLNGEKKALAEVKASDNEAFQQLFEDNQTNFVEIEGIIKEMPVNIEFAPYDGYKTSTGESQILKDFEEQQKLVKGNALIEVTLDAPRTEMVEDGHHLGFYFLWTGIIFYVLLIIITFISRMCGIS